MLNERKGDLLANKTNDMAHTKWLCKYHIVFTPKYRGNIQSIQKRFTGHNKNFMWIQGGRNNRRKINARSCSYTGKYST